MEKIDKLNFRGRRLENIQNLTQNQAFSNFARTQTGRLPDKSVYKLKSSNCGLVMNSYLNDNLEDQQFFSLDSFSSKAIPLFFLFYFRLASNAFPDI